MPKPQILDYDTVWEVMNNLDETVQKCKQINDMCDDMLATVIEWTDADEVIDTIDLLRGYSKYILRELENNSITAWNETVVKLNPNNKRQSHSDLDALDGDWETIFKDNPELLLHPSLMLSKNEGDTHDSEGC
tara:strand:- start:301 stop:699 length:399 start_codon:yes stop_codon:yes gene_type:complete